MVGDVYGGVRHIPVHYIRHESSCRLWRTASDSSSWKSATCPVVEPDEVRVPLVAA